MGARGKGRQTPSGCSVQLRVCEIAQHPVGRSGAGLARGIGEGLRVLGVGAAYHPQSHRRHNRHWPMVGGTGCKCCCSGAPFATIWHQSTCWRTHSEKRPRKPATSDLFPSQLRTSLGPTFLILRTHLAGLDIPSVDRRKKLSTHVSHCPHSISYQIVEESKG